MSLISHYGLMHNGPIGADGVHTTSPTAHGGVFPSRNRHVGARDIGAQKRKNELHSASIILVHETSQGLGVQLAAATKKARAEAAIMSNEFEEVTPCDPPHPNPIQTLVVRVGATSFQESGAAGEAPEDQANNVCTTCDDGTRKAAVA